MTKCKFCSTNTDETKSVCSVCGLDTTKKYKEFFRKEKKAYKGIRLLKSAANLFFYFYIIFIWIFWEEIVSKPSSVWFYTIPIIFSIIYIYLWIGLQKLSPLAWKIAIGITALNLLGTVAILMDNFINYSTNELPLTLVVCAIFLFIPAGDSLLSDQLFIESINA